MFKKRNLRVLVTDDDVFAEDGVIVKDRRTQQNYYPTAEQARNIESEIRWNVVEDSVKFLLTRVVESAKNERNWVRVKFAQPVRPLEEKEIYKKISELGYNYEYDFGSFLITW